MHNETCGCAECQGLGNPYAPHNQTCGCAECDNYTYKDGRRWLKNYNPPGGSSKARQPVGSAFGGALDNFGSSESLTVERRPSKKRMRKGGRNQ